MYAYYFNAWLIVIYINIPNIKYASVGEMSQEVKWPTWYAIRRVGSKLYNIYRLAIIGLTNKIAIIDKKKLQHYVVITQNNILWLLIVTGGGHPI